MANIRPDENCGGDLSDRRGRTAYISRTESFSSAHRLHSEYLNDEENRELYGLCNNPNGHGHNYKVEVIVKGEVDPVTGMVMNISDLKKYIKKHVLDEMDHKHLDLDVAHFKNTPSTAENIAIFIWDQLKNCLPEGLLYEVKVHETDKNVAFYRGE